MTETLVYAAIIALAYGIGGWIGYLIGRRRGRARAWIDLTADPAQMRAIAASIEDARFRSAEADATRRVGGLIPREE